MTYRTRRPAWVFFVRTFPVPRYVQGALWLAKGEGRFTSGGFFGTVSEGIHYAANDEHLAKA
jgi:hypothetical protein